MFENRYVKCVIGYKDLNEKTNTRECVRRNPEEPRVNLFLDISTQLDVIFKVRTVDQSSKTNGVSTSMSRRRPTKCKRNAIGEFLYESKKHLNHLRKYMERG